MTWAGGGRAGRRRGRRRGRGRGELTLPRRPTRRRRLARGTGLAANVPTCSGVAAEGWPVCRHTARRCNSCTGSGSGAVTAGTRLLARRSGWAIDLAPPAPSQRRWACVPAQLRSLPRDGVGKIMTRWQDAVSTPATNHASRTRPHELHADVELRSASVLDHRIWRPQARVAMLYGSLGTHRALSQI